MTVQQQLKGMQSSKQRYVKGIPFVIERYMKGVFPSKMVYKNGKGLDPGVYPYKHPLGFCVFCTRAELFEGRLALNQGLNLIRVSFCVQKHFLG